MAHECVFLAKPTATTNQCRDIGRDTERLQFKHTQLIITYNYSNYPVRNVGKTNTTCMKYNACSRQCWDGHPCLGSLRTAVHVHKRKRPVWTQTTNKTCTTKRPFLTQPNPEPGNGTWNSAVPYRSTPVTQLFCPGRWIALHLRKVQRRAVR